MSNYDATHRAYDGANEDPALLDKEIDAVLRLGLMYMAAGTSGYRILRGMKRAARALGFDRLDAVVSTSSISCTFFKGEDFKTVIVTHEPPGVDSSRIEALDNLTHNLPPRVDYQYLNERMAHIKKYVVKRWNRYVVSIAAGLACFGFALLNRFSVTEAVLALFAALIGQFVRATLASKHINHLAVVGVSGVTASVVYYAELRILEACGHDVSILGGGFIAAVLFLVPGFPLYSSLLDLARFDITAGVSRLLYALSLATVATISVSMVTWVVGLSPELTQSTDLVWWKVIVGSFLGIGGFSILFNSSKRMIVVSMVIGTIGNAIRLELILNHDFKAQYAAFVAGVIIGVLAGHMTRGLRIPRITITVPAAVIMVPGALMYRSMYYLNESDMEKMLINFTSAAVIVLCISAGLAVARLLTDKDWAFGNPIDFHRYRSDPPNLRWH